MKVKGYMFPPPPHQPPSPGREGSGEGGREGGRDQVKEEGREGGKGEEVTKLRSCTGRKVRREH